MAVNLVNELFFISFIKENQKRHYVFILPIFVTI